METKELKYDEAKKMLEEMKEEYNLEQLSEWMKDNKIPINYKDKKYRVRILNLEDKERIQELKIKKFGQLLNDEDIFAEKQLIEKYKDKDINLEEINLEIKKLEADKKSIYNRLGEAIANKIEEKVIRDYKEQIEQIDDKIKVKEMQINHYLSFSLERQLRNYVTKIITFFSLEMCETADEEEVWKRAFSSLEDFEKNIEEELLMEATYKTMLLN